MANVEIYTKLTCPYCHRAKALLKQKGVEPDEIAIDFGGDKRQEMTRRARGQVSRYAVRRDSPLAA